MDEHSKSSPSESRTKSFLHSNLFAALCVWFLTQSIFGAGLVISYWARSQSLMEWKTQTDATIKRMDEQGTMHSHYIDEREDKDIADLQARMKRSEDEGRHWEVIEAEHRRLTRDVEELRTPKK